MNMKRVVLAIGLVAAMGLAALGGTAVGGAAVYYAVRGNVSQSAPLPGPEQQPIAEPSPQDSTSELHTVDVQTAITEAVAKVSPAVVTVINDMGNGKASGSGVIISTDG